MRPEPTGVRFFKMSGGGNDFIAVRDPDFLTPSHVEALCARGHSLGADGAFSIEPLPDTAAPSVRMTYFNGDGTLARLCVNGTRCAALLAFHLGWADDRVTVVTGAGEIDAERTAEFEIALALEPPPERAVEKTVELAGEELRGWFVDTGVPHFVLEWPESLVRAPVNELGPEIRHSHHFDAGANVDFVRVVGPDRLEIRTFERGVEGETLACGTGVLAAAAVAVQLSRAGLPLKALTSGGFELVVSGSVTAERSIEAWTLAGDARLVAEGVLSAGALLLPDPPLWSD
ncbi:MAG: diaminopimelate epimerase [bacterium]|nr:diaminopimelate epimerase [bacterium]